MKKTINRILALSLAFLTLFAGIVLPAEKALADERYNNTNRAVISCSINSSGSMAVNMDVIGKKGITTKISTELYVEKKVLGIFWTKIDIDSPNNIWTDTVNSYMYSRVFSKQLAANGTYRVTVKFTISGSGGANDIITLTDTKTY